MTEPSCAGSYTWVGNELRRRLAEPPNYLIQLVTGPRQVGKTTLLLELAREHAPCSIYTAADAPEAALSGWWENLWVQASALAATSCVVVVLLDEVQYLPDWSRLLKSKQDELKRAAAPIWIVASGSSALALGSGSRETMAGRFERLILSHWQATELASRFQLDGSRAALEVVRMGGYPGAMALAGDPGRWRAYLRDSIVEPAIGRDLLATQPIRRPALLRQVFAIAVGHPAEVVALQKIRGLLSDAGSLETLAHYLDLLEEAFLVTAVRKYSGKVLRRRAAAPKLVTLNNALLASWADAPRPGRNVDPARFGRWVENACLAMAWNCGQDIHYWRDGPLEVDLVSRGSWGRWAVEIKTGRVATRDLSGALEFCRRYPEFRPALVCDAERVEIGARARVTAISWEEFLLDGLHLAD